MKPGRITGALGGLFGAIGAIADAAKPDPVRARRRQILKWRTQAAALRVKAKHAPVRKRDRLLAKARAIEQTLRDEGLEVDSDEMDP